MRNLMLKSIIDDILKDHGYSEAKLARMLNVSRSTVRGIRLGTTTEPRYQTVSRLLTLYFTLQHQVHNKQRKL